ncbi:GIY-YIG nuclease family protein [Flavobacteriaceae bacterium 3-367]|uniref:GIY-YIG nuclease family protein n=1 Tax=Eudoraea algarum TaxID=3417568 RepID=UPI0032680192
MCYVYILYSHKNGRYYIGQTANLDDRLRRHNNGTERATAPYRPWSLVPTFRPYGSRDADRSVGTWHTEKETRGEAMMLEHKLKNLSGPRIKDFIRRHS